MILDLLTSIVAEILHSLMYTSSTERSEQINDYH